MTSSFVDIVDGYVDIVDGDVDIVDGDVDIVDCDVAIADGDVDIVEKFVDAFLSLQQPGCGARWWFCNWHLPDQQVGKYIFQTDQIYLPD